MCRTGNEAFTRRLVHGVALAIAAENNFVPLFKSFIADVLKCKARLKVKFKCVFVTMYSVVISSFSRDYKSKNRQIKISTVFHLS